MGTPRPHVLHAAGTCLRSKQKYPCRSRTCLTECALRLRVSSDVGNEAKGFGPDSDELRYETQQRVVLIMRTWNTMRRCCSLRIAALLNRSSACTASCACHSGHRACLRRTRAHLIHSAPFSPCMRLLERSGRENMSLCTMRASRSCSAELKWFCAPQRCCSRL